MEEKNILEKIVEQRKATIREKSHTMGCAIPATRQSPLVPFVKDPFLICEIKRRSPSKGDIAPGLDSIGQASLYSSSGVRSVSVLTESGYFGGSLDDLMNVKRAFPSLALLRKDFLFSKEDIDISYRAGADAVLLIASILTARELALLHSHAESLGLTALVEVHSDEDIEKARLVKPSLTGINSRDLATFSIDIAFPLRARKGIDWETSLLFESGIHSEEDARVALGAGFRGILVGEAVVRRPELILELIHAFALPKRDFWGRLYKRTKPFVKVCGITNEDDARVALENGADALGFIFASSPRRCDTALPRKLQGLDILKVGVVVTNGKADSLDPEVRMLLDEGFLDAIQLHGTEAPSECYALAFPYYKALRLGKKEEAAAICDYKCPRVLIDAFSDKGMGGTGENLPEEIVREAASKKPLWLAGGLDPENVRSIVDTYSPELVDASSRLESSRGKKDRSLVTRFIREAKKIRSV
jgi:indole-3-glycerol phosphate synthase/phosphoribosylanthranilate isomerase